MIKYIIIALTFMNFQLSPLNAMDEDIPEKGWRCRTVTDSGKRDSDCERCSTKIRYIHTMIHKECDKEFNVGCECAARMENDSDTAKRRQDFYKNKPQFVWEHVGPPKEEMMSMKKKTLSKKTKTNVLSFKDKATGRYFYNVRGKSEDSFDNMKEAQQAAIKEYLGIE